MRAKWLMLNSSMIALLMGVLLAGCSSVMELPKTPGPQRPTAPSDAALTPTDPTKATPYSTPTPTLTAASAGELVFKKNCGTCHSLPTSDRLKVFPSDNAMSDWVKIMAQLAELNADETQKVLDYTQTLRRSGR